MTRTRASLVGLIATLIALAGITVAAQHDSAHGTPPAYPYEVIVCWRMDAPDLTNPASYEWPQTKVDCSVVPPVGTSVCGSAAKYQVDTYWIRDDADRDYLAGMTTMSSSSDDGSDSPTTRNLEPHGYYAVLVTEKPAADCLTPTPPPTTAPPTPSEPPTTAPPTSKPPKPHHPTNPPKAVPPSRECIDENTIKVTHSDGTVDFVSDNGVCDSNEEPPAVEEGF